MVDFRNDDTDGDDVVENVDQENDITADDADAADDDDDNAGDDKATTATTSITATVDDFRQYIQSVVGNFSRQPPNRHHNGIIIRTTIRNAMNQMLDSGRSNEQDQQRFIECLNMLANEYQGSFYFYLFLRRAVRGGIVSPILISPQLLFCHVLVYLGTNKKNRIGELYFHYFKSSDVTTHCDTTLYRRYWMVLERHHSSPPRAPPRNNITTVADRIVSFPTRHPRFQPSGSSRSHHCSNDHHESRHRG